MMDAEKKLGTKVSGSKTNIWTRTRMHLFNQVSEDNDVSVKQIKQWIREERLSLSEASLDGVTCEHCGRPIRTGRFCEKCKAAMANSFANSIEKPKPLEPQKKERDGNKMRFL